MLARTRARRWSDNDHYFGPFTYAKDTRYRSWGICYASAGEEDRGNSLRFSGFGRTLIIALPEMLKPWKEPFGEPITDPDLRARIGPRYYHTHRREFSFSFSRTGTVGDSVSLHLHWGAQTHDSRTDCSKCYFLPWTEWRHVRHSLYGLKGECIATVPEKGNWSDHRALVETCPTVTFSFYDFDGEMITAKTRIEEREWRHGAGWFKWLSWFNKPMIQRRLDIDFSDETGKEKGSWKGGVIGTSEKLHPGELHEAAFRRYCAEHRMSFVGFPSKSLSGHQNAEDRA